MPISSLLQDVNSDGAADILVGAYRADPTGSMAGTAYVVFGSYSWSSDVVDLAELGAAGLMLEGGAQRDYAGYSVASAGGAVVTRNCKNSNG